MTSLDARAVNFKTDHWSVTVERNGENVVVLESDCHSGRELQPGDSEAIWLAAIHLLAFIGCGAPRRFDGES